MKEKIENLISFRNQLIKNIYKSRFGRSFDFAITILVNPTAFSVRRDGSFLTYRKALDKVLRIAYTISTMITTLAFAQG